MDDSSLTNGLLAKRAEVSAVNADLRERMAIVANDIEALERVLQSFGYGRGRHRWNLTPSQTAASGAHSARTACGCEVFASFLIV